MTSPATSSVRTARIPLPKSIVSNLIFLISLTKDVVRKFPEIPVHHDFPLQGHSSFISEHVVRVGLSQRVECHICVSLYRCTNVCLLLATGPHALGMTVQIT